MNYSIYGLLWFFIVYSFAGWAVGTAIAAVREKKVVLLVFYVSFANPVIIDFVGTVRGILSVRSQVKAVSVIYKVSEDLQNAADTMGEELTGWVLKHLKKAYPNLDTHFPDERIEQIYPNMIIVE